MANSKINNLIIVAPFTSVPGEFKFNRFLLLANLFSNIYNVTLITSNYNHNDKMHNRLHSYVVNDNLEIICLNEIGYKKNISIKRFLSHIHFTLNFFLFLKKNKNKFHNSKVIGAYPLIFPLFFLAFYRIKYKYKLIIDINDIWPQAFGHLLPKFCRFILDSNFINMISHYIFKRADAISSVSETYLKYGIKVNPCVESYVLYLGGDKKIIDICSNENGINKNEINFSYIGALGTSYDLKTCILAFNKFNSFYDKKIYFHLIGDGPERFYLQKISNANILFHGFLDYKDMLRIAKKSDYLVNPIKDGASQSVTNKLSDYILLSKPIISSQDSIEIKSFFDDNSYLIYKAGDVQDLTNKIEQGLKYFSKFEINNDLLVKFDRNISYLKYVEWVNNIK